MTRLVLKKGFSLHRTPEGATHLLDVRSGDALVLAASDFEALSQALRGGGLDPEAKGPASLAYRFAPFLAPTNETETLSFDELDFDDVPQRPAVPTIPAVAPLTRTPRVSPPAQSRSPAPARPPVRGSGGFKEAAPSLSGDRPEAWSLLPISTPEQAPVPETPSAPEPPQPSAAGDEWVAGGAMPETEPGDPAGSPHLAEAVSPLLPSIDELLRAALPAPAVDTSSATLPEAQAPIPDSEGDAWTAPSTPPVDEPVASAAETTDFLEQFTPPTAVPSPSGEEPGASAAETTDFLEQFTPPTAVPSPSVEEPGAPAAETNDVVEQVTSLTAVPSPSAEEPGAPAAETNDVVEQVTSLTAVPSPSADEPGAPAAETNDVVEQVTSLTAVPSLSADEAEGVAAPKTTLTPTGSEQELREALAAAAEQPAVGAKLEDEPLLTTALLPVDEMLEELPGATLEPLPEPAPDRSQEDNLRAALEQTEPAPQGRDEVQAFLADTARNFEAEAPAPPQAQPPAPEPDFPQLPSSRKPMVLTFVGVTLLVLGVSVSMMLKPGGGDDARPPEPLDAGATAADVTPPKPPVTPEPVDAGTQAAASLDAGQPARAAAEAPTPTPVLDAGTPRPAPAADAGLAAPPPATEPSFTAEVISRGRVKMGVVAAPGPGAVSWAVDDGQRVKSKQALGTVTVEGKPRALAAPSVGLAMLKQASGTTVKRGAVLAEIIYFEAWAKAVVKGAVPMPTWRCAVVSPSAGARAPCKISVVTPKGDSALVVVAIEPRWFDTAADAVLHVQPE